MSLLLFPSLLRGIILLNNLKIKVIGLGHSKHIKVQKSFEALKTDETARIRCTSKSPAKTHEVLAEFILYNITSSLAASFSNRTLPLKAISIT